MDSPMGLGRRGARVENRPRWTVSKNGFTSRVVPFGAMKMIEENEVGKTRQVAKTLLKFFFYKDFAFNPFRA
jgi:hypothetical protein